VKLQNLPEILAPAGDETCLRAAVGAGADAVYFGLSSGFNARAKAANFAPEDLPRVFGFLHEHGVKGYVAFNTLVYDREVEVAERLIEAIARAGADAAIVQDLGVARLCHEIAPTLPIHASTQMTISSPEGAAVAAELGVVRVILPRELSIEEIRRLRARTSLELECFVHGALCMSWSGQCLTSEAWGQRSANRGQCAQSCRLPYDLVVDRQVRALGLEKYLLSPMDLGAYNLLPELFAAGISCFKIEGRYKGPEYVAATVEKYRKVVDALAEGRVVRLGREDEEEMALTYSRGFSPGWLLGDDHQALTHGLYPGHRGLRFGTVERLGPWRVHVRPEPGAPGLAVGDWVIFDQGSPSSEEPQGGTFAVEPPGPDGLVEVRFGDPGPDLGRVRPGDVVWKSHSSALKRRLLRALEARRRVALDVVVRGAAGRPLVVEGRDVLGRSARATGDAPLEPARHAPLGEPVLRSKLGALGDTRYFLRRVEVALEGDVATSPAELKRLRRRLVEALEALPIPVRTHAVRPRAGAVARSAAPAPAPAPLAASIVPLCRTLDQVDAVLDAGAREVYVDFMEFVGVGEALKRLRARGARAVVATPRIQKPGEEPIDRRLEALAPDGVLARHLGALHHYRARAAAGESGFTLHGDFSLNAANALTASTLLAFGLATLTPAYDLNVAQLAEMAAALPAERLEVTVHQHLPLYHTEYCLYCRHLSDGHDYRDCGRPCERHRISLRCPKGREHPVLVDVSCRNTVFNAEAQSAAPHLARLRACGIRRFRIELVWETGDEAARVLAAYTALLAGRKSVADVVREVGAIERYGVTSGTLATLR